MGFYNPNFRDLWFRRTKRWGLFGAVLSVLAGNWRPSLAVRLRIRLFFMLVALQRALPIAPRGPRTPAEQRWRAFDRGGSRSRRSLAVGPVPLGLH